MRCRATAAHDHRLPNEFNNFCFRFDAVNRKSRVIIPSNPSDQNGLTVSLKFLSGTTAGKAAKSKDIFSRVVRLCSKQPVSQSSAFNTIILSNLIHIQLQYLCFCVILCEWICSFLSPRPQGGNYNL